jgi:hypothetical protein
MAECTDLKRRLDAAAPAQVAQTHERVASKGAATPKHKPKADAATRGMLTPRAPSLV